MVKERLVVFAVLIASSCRPPGGELDKGSGGNLWALSGDSQARYSEGGVAYPLTRRVDHCYEAGGGVGAFAACRDLCFRKHAGCDFYGEAGEPIVAIEDGEILRAPYSFYCNTDALEVRHSSGVVVRYGEIKPGSVVLGSGARIRKGDHIARMGRLSCYFQPMLHFEMYAGTATGSLTGGGAYRRRSDLTDPTKYVFAWKVGGGPSSPGQESPARGERCDWDKVQVCLKYNGGNPCYAKHGCVDSAPPSSVHIEEYGSSVTGGGSPVAGGRVIPPGSITGTANNPNASGGGTGTPCNRTQLDICLRYEGGNACYAKWHCSR